MDFLVAAQRLIVKKRNRENDEIWRRIGKQTKATKDQIDRRKRNQIEAPGKRGTKVPGDQRRKMEMPEIKAPNSNLEERKIRIGVEEEEEGQEVTPRQKRRRDRREERRKTRKEIRDK